MIELRDDFNPIPTPKKISPEELASRLKGFDGAINEVLKSITSEDKENKKGIMELFGVVVGLLHDKASYSAGAGNITESTKTSEKIESLKKLLGELEKDERTVDDFLEKARKILSD